MKSLLQVYGIFRKEFFVQSRFRLVTLNRLLIGPVISSVSAGVIYSGFFSVDRNLQLGDMNANNYLTRLIFGFLVHNYLNSGYYFMGNKFLGEWAGRTLSLLWFAPCSRWVLLAGINSLEYLRCLVITFVGLGIMQYLEPQTLTVILAELAVFTMVFALGTLIGFLRVSLHLSNEGRSEILDNAYLAFIFTGCLYIPVEILPKVLQPICRINPAYNASRLMSGIWTDQGALAFNILSILGSMAVLILFTALIWKVCRRSILERSF